MRESASQYQSDANQQMQSSPPRSYTAMILSGIIPGLGQLYLHRLIKAFIVFFLFLTGVVLFYLNSYPVRELSDLFNFRSDYSSGFVAGDSDDGAVQNAVQLWTFDDGKSLWFRPSMILKVTALIQVIFCWIYAVYDGWRVEHEIDVRTYQRNRNIQDL